MTHEEAKSLIARIRWYQRAYAKACRESEAAYSRYLQDPCRETAEESDKADARRCQLLKKAQEIGALA